MNTWKITLEYDGTKYHGWQEQNNARTVLGELRQAAGELFGEPCDMQGSGRTDAGVHAIAQVVHLRVETHRGWKAFEIQYGLNDRLPSDIVVLDVEESSPGFHARHDAVSRSYVYQIAIRKTAFAKRHVWWVKEKLDQAPMIEAAKLLAGRHNFVNFIAKDPSKPGESTIVHVESAYLEMDDFMLVFHITASHYLWKMVRRIVGTLVKVGLNEVTVAQFAELLEGKQMPELPVPEWTAPASGLFLERVLYPGDEMPVRHEPATAEELAVGTYVAPGTVTEPINIPFVKNEERSAKPPRREAVIPADKFVPEPLITRGGDRPPMKRREDGPGPLRPPFSGGGDRGGERPRFQGPPRRDDDRPSYGGDRGGDRPRFQGPPRRDDDRPSYGGDRGGDRPRFQGPPRGDGDRPPFRGGDDRPRFQGPPRGRDNDRPSYGGDRGGDRPRFQGPPRGDGDRPPFRGGDVRPRFQGPPRGRDNDRPSHGGDRGGDRPRFQGPPRGDGDQPKFPGESRPQYQKPEGGGDRPPFRGGDRPPFRGGEDRPRFQGPPRGGDRPPFRGGGEDRPRFQGPPRGGDRPPFRGGDDRPKFGGGGDRPKFGGPPRDGGGRPPFRGGDDRPKFDGPRSEGGPRPERRAGPPAWKTRPNPWEKGPGNRSGAGKPGGKFAGKSGGKPRRG